MTQAENALRTWEHLHDGESVPFVVEPGTDVAELQAEIVQLFLEKYDVWAWNEETDTEYQITEAADLDWEMDYFGDTLWLGEVGIDSEAEYGSKGWHDEPQPEPIFVETQSLQNVIDGMMGE